jgi:hypothetical protein
LGRKEKLVGISGSVSGGLSVLGSYQVCHNVCMGLISLLTVLGITIAGMPLLFLTKVALPFWALACGLLLASVVLKLSGLMPFSGKLLLLNAGLLTAGIPFQQLQHLNRVFWTIGGLIVLASLLWWVYGKVASDEKAADRTA